MIYNYVTRNTRYILIYFKVIVNVQDLTIQKIYKYPTKKQFVTHEREFLKQI